MATEATMIEIRRLCVNFGAQRTLHEIDLSIPPASFTAIVGPSGCGKSTLLRCIASLNRPTSGQVSVAAEASTDIAFVFQSPNLLPWRNVLQNISLPLELHERTESIASAEKATEICRLVGLKESDFRKYPKMLSGGMQMRVSLARALVTQPKILLLDEPFAALDDILRQELNGELLRLWSEQRWTSLFVTHNVAEAVFLSQRIIVLSKQPATVASVIDIPFDYPREATLRTTAEFNTICERVLTCFLESCQ